MRVLELWRYPVKSLQGECLEAAEVGLQGIRGDRQHAIFDTATGLGLTARRAPEMLFASARAREDGGVEITLPDGSIAADDAALSAWLGRPVALRSTDQVAERRYESPQDTETEAAHSWNQFVGSDAGFHDSGRASVSLVSTGTLAGHHPRRFRANVLLDASGEDALIGSTVHVGGAVLGITMAITRCVLVTRPQPGGVELDRDVLRWVHRERSGVLAVGAVVSGPGTVRVGDGLA